MRFFAVSTSSTSGTPSWISTEVADSGEEAGTRGLKRLEQAATKAGSKDRMKAADKLTVLVDGELRFRSDPPILVPVEELYDDVNEAEAVKAIVADALRFYRSTLTSDRGQLFDEYQYSALARKVVGVGSVGTRCWVGLFIGQDNDDPLILQVKEAEASVLERFTNIEPETIQGKRVVEGQRLMQAASDIFLGWERHVSPDGVTRDFYIRQLWDWKASADIESIDPDLLVIYAGMCAWTLARAHARSGDEIAISAYLGSGDVFDQSVADFAVAYADQNDADHSAFVAAITDGRIPAVMGV